jgi:hypothetical protein
LRIADCGMRNDFGSKIYIHSEIHIPKSEIELFIIFARSKKISQPNDFGFWIADFGMG